MAIAELHLAELARNARRADEEPVWPEGSWAVLQQAGGLRWSIPKVYGGEGLGGADLLQRYESLAGACLTTCFLLSQRDAACRRLLAGGNERLCRELLPGVAWGEKFITVGLAQLTTSRQHTKPAVTARQVSDGFLINGVIPWVTGALQAQHLVIGAVTDNGQQILGVLPTDLPGVVIGAPLELMALQGSLTAEVRCDGVRLPREWLIAGPAERVLSGERGGTGGLETSCLALGLAGAAVRHLDEEARLRPELAADASRWNKALHNLRQELYGLASAMVTAESAQKLRARANTLVLRVTGAALAVSKGVGFLRHHPAQRWARQALFFLVWSCPWPVMAATLAHLAPAEEESCG